MLTEKVINDMQSILEQIGITDGDNRALDNSICFDAQLADKEYLVRVYIGVDEESSLVSMMIFPDFEIPEEKIRFVLEMVNQINKCATVDHVVYKPDLSKVFVIKGLMLTDEGLDKIEFDKAIRTILGNSGFYLDTIKERLSSEEKTEDIFNRMYKDSPVSGNRG